MTNQSSLFAEATAPATNPAAELPLVPCGGGVPGYGCGKLIPFAMTEKEAAMPIDPEPVPNGNLVFTGARSVRVLKKGEVVPEGTARYVSHFGTCPRAKNFRR